MFDDKTECYTLLDAILDHSSAVGTPASALLAIVFVGGVISGDNIPTVPRNELRVVLRGASSVSI